MKSIDRLRWWWWDFEPREWFSRKFICPVLGHKFTVHKMYDVLCERCRICKTSS